MSRIPVITCLMGCILALLGVLYRPVKTSEEVKDKAGGGSMLIYIDRILGLRCISTAMNLIVKNKSFFINRYLAKLLELSEAGINIKQFYLIKFIVLILTAALASAVIHSNAIYNTRMIIETSGNESIFTAIGTSTFHKPDYKLYRQIYAKVDSKSLLRRSYPEQNIMVREVVAQIIDSCDSKDINETAIWFLNIFSNTEANVRIHMEYILWILGSFCFPDLLLFIRWLIIGSVYKREVVKLEYVFELLARVDGMKTIDIVKQLEKSSKIYSKYFCEFLQIFIFDKRRAFTLLKGKNIKSLSRLSGILEVYSMTDKEIAMQILEREIMERDEAILLTIDENIDFIDIIAFLSIVPIVYELARLILNPMLDMVYRAFELV